MIPRQQSSSSTSSLLTNSQRLFASHLYQALQNETHSDQQTRSSSSSPNEPMNIIFSPFSVFMALSMTMCGASNETLRDMASGLSIPFSMDQFAEFKQQVMKPFMSKMMKQVLDKNSSELALANRIYVAHNATLVKEFQDFVKEAFDSQVETCNFEQNASNERIKINEWVEKQTNHLIKNLLPQQAVNRDTRVILVNAIYFLGTWKTQFDKKLTKNNQLFYLLNHDEQSKDRTCKVTMMNMSNAKVPYGSNNCYKWVRLYYSNTEFSMTLVLPESNPQQVTVESEKKLDEFISQQVASPCPFSTSETKLTTLSIPKFNIEYETSMSEILKQTPFSMTSAFQNSDFSNLSANEPLQISDVIHKAVIKVDESGTEAAAATAVVMTRCAAVSHKPTYAFIANRPFGLIIRHEPTETVLFMGKVNRL
ncbi:hypothetical protein C9374_006687 [Naegleria lovaniensis]|uniref:Serpin domain-containing protein n=1 Tax=Naegleria lovaniensis TaxID=51637 RepID=A0AA88KHH4_NAELO|nr:uncharacterized protein C9374_006687 [Naegleria lovaniensis]KAG2379570.1 hypothetical protein C9374_006687 [Naegleria lovaniensis]